MLLASRSPRETGTSRPTYRSYTTDRLSFTAVSIVLLIGLMLLLLMVARFDFALQWDLSWVVTALMCIVAGLICVQHKCLGGFAHAPVVYFLYLAVYHLALAVVVVWVPSEKLQDVYFPYSWIFDNETKPALVVTALALVGVVLGAMIVPKFLSPWVVQRVIIFSDQPTSNDNYNSPPLFRCGMAMLGISLALFLRALYTGGGTNLLLANYETIRGSLVDNPVFANSVYLLGAGGIIAIASAPRSRLHWPFLLSCMIAIPLLMTGNRGEVLFPLLVFIVVLYRRGLTIPRWVLASGIAATLILISLIAQVRRVGIEGVSNADVHTDVVGSIMELGTALRPVTTMVAWLSSGDDYMLGSSYWLPFERMLSYTLPTIFVKNSSLTDPRFLATQVVLRTGHPMGYSTIAEAFYNWGGIGVACVFCFTGIILTWLHYRADTASGLAILGLVLFPLVNNVRNSFIFVPGQIALGLGAVAATHLISALLRQLRGR